MSRKTGHTCKITQCRRRHVTQFLGLLRSSPTAYPSYCFLYTSEENQNRCFLKILFPDKADKYCGVRLTSQLQNSEVFEYQKDLRERRLCRQRGERQRPNTLSVPARPATARRPRGAGSDLFHGER